MTWPKKSPHGSGDFFFCLWALLKSSDRNRQRVFLRARCRSSVNRQWSHFCRQIWATVYTTWTICITFEFLRQKCSSPRSQCCEMRLFWEIFKNCEEVGLIPVLKLKVLSNVKSRWFCNYFKKRGTTQRLKIQKSLIFFTILSKSFIFCPKIQLWFRDKIVDFLGEKLVKMLWFWTF